MYAYKFAAVIFTALALVPGGAHVLSLANKIGLAAEPYFVAQGIYRGWALLGIVLFAAIAADALLALAQFRRGERFLPALAATCW